MALTPKQARFVAELPSGFYCYALLDQGEPFYVGKGKRRRVFVHEAEARKGGVSEKCARIRAIWARGNDIGYRVLGAYSTEAEAYEAEREWIASIPGLTNIASGGGGERITAKERMRRQAEDMLQRLVPFDQWSRTVSSQMRDAVIRVSGSLEAFYRLCVSHLERDAVEPQPNTLTVMPNGSHVLGWE